MSGWDRPEWEHLSEVEKRCAALWLHVDPSKPPGPPTGLLVGEMPAAGSGSLPLFPHPKNSAGGRLLLWSRITPTQYLGRLRRTNIYTTATEEPWDPAHAELRAQEITEQLTDGTRVVLLGKRVSEAFQVWVPFKMERRGRIFLTSIPHPSGRNLVYNDAVARMGAAAAVQWAADCIAPPSDKDLARARAGKKR